MQCNRINLSRTFYTVLFYSIKLTCSKCHLGGISILTFKNRNSSSCIEVYDQIVIYVIWQVFQQTFLSFYSVYNLEPRGTDSKPSPTQYEGVTQSANKKDFFFIRHMGRNKADDGMSGVIQNFPNAILVFAIKTSIHLLDCNIFGMQERGTLNLFVVCHARRDL